MKKALIIFLHIFLTFTIYAQTLNVDGAVVSLSDNAILSVDGTAVNDGSIENKGIITISENWANLKNYLSETGIFVLNGQELQTINHNNQNFNILQINGTGEKIITANATISTKLELIEGVVTPETGVIITLLDGAETDAGHASSYINGVFYTEGTGDKFYPIGKDAYYRPVELINIEGETPVIGMETYASNPNAIAGRELLEVSKERYWEMTLLSGTYNDALIKIYYGEEENIEDIEYLVVAEASEIEGPYRNIGNSEQSGDNIEGTVTSEKNASGKYFAVGKYREMKAEDIYIPNALSPNAPDNNDKVIKIYGDLLLEQDFKFIVYNKWGNLIFTSSSLDLMTTKGWDGMNTKTGNNEITGTFNYIMVGILKNGEKVERKGSILLIK